MFVACLAAFYSLPTNFAFSCPRRSLFYGVGGEAKRRNGYMAEQRFGDRLRKGYMRNRFRVLDFFIFSTSLRAVSIFAFYSLPTSSSF